LIRGKRRRQFGSGINALSASAVPPIPDGVAAAPKASELCQDQNKMMADFPTHGFRLPRLCWGFAWKAAPPISNLAVRKY
jgi:hypothetical protein